MDNNRIKDLREDNFYTQEYVADMINLTRSAYSKYEYLFKI